MNLFQEVDFTGHSGGQLHWKIECDALSDGDWKCLAKMISEVEKRPFQAAVGIPRGGVKLGTYLNEYGTGNPKHPYIICDDVLTTGGSMNDYKDKYFSKYDCFGWVIWNRGRNEADDWIESLFNMHTNTK